MADSVASIGIGTSLRGKSPDYTGLAVRMGETARIRKQKETDTLAKDLEFDQSALKDLYPAFAQQVLDRRIKLVNQYEKDKAQYGQIQARNNLVKAKVQAQAEDAVTMNNNRKAADLIAKDKLTNIVSNQDALNAAVNKQYPTDQDWAAFNDPDLGFNADGGNIQGTAIPRMNLPQTLQKDHENDIVFDKEDVKRPDIGQGAYDRTPIQRLSGTGMNNAVKNLIGDETKFKNFLSQNREWLQENHPDAIPSNNPDDDSRLQAQKDAAMDYIQQVFPVIKGKVETYNGRAYPQGTAAERDQKNTRLVPSTESRTYTKDELTEPYNQYKRTMQSQKAKWDAVHKVEMDAFGTTNEELLKRAKYRKENKEPRIKDLDEFLVTERPVRTYTLEKPDNKKNAEYFFMKEDGKTEIKGTPDAIHVSPKNNKLYILVKTPLQNARQGEPTQYQTEAVPYRGQNKSRADIEFQVDEKIRPLLKSDFGQEDYGYWMANKSQKNVARETKVTKKDDPLGIFD